MAGMPADPSDPFAQSDMVMHERMAAASGRDLSETWLRKMIEHHRGALTMSQVVLIDRGGDPRLVALAREIIAKQQREIAEMEQLAAASAGDGPAAADAFAAMEQGMHRQMMQASGDTFSQTWRAR